ncbi:MAG: hypothetical protein Q7R54_00025, partial [bacterium]|nr:hypothetical protein [bacterium]
MPNLVCGQVFCKLREQGNAKLRYASPPNAKHAVYCCGGAEMPPARAFPKKVQEHFFLPALASGEYEAYSPLISLGSNLRNASFGIALSE